VYLKGYKKWREKVRAASGQGRTRVPISSLLDKRTLTGNSTPAWSLCVTDLSKVGVVDVGWSLQTGRSRAKVREDRSPLHPEDNQRRAQARARRKVRTACLQIQALYILTLTYHENMQDRQQAILHRQEFDRRMKKHYGWWSYVGVLEAQKRGALHWHLAVPVRVDEALALEEWRFVTGDPTITQVHVGFEPNGHGNAFVKCAHYISKYLGKEMNQREAEDHRYHIGRGVLPEAQRLKVSEGVVNGIPSEVFFAMDIVYHLLGKDVDIWMAPQSLPGQRFGFLRASKISMQPDSSDAPA